MESHFIYNPDGVGSHCHSASIVFHGGELFASWYAYVEKETEKGQICFARYNASKGQWDKGETIFKNLSSVSCGNPVLFSEPESGELHLYFVILKYHYWDSAQIYHSSSNDGGCSWKEPARLMLDDGLMVRHRPEILNGNTLLIPAYDEKGNKTLFFKSSPPYESWQYHSEVEGECIQADFFNYRGSEWQAFLRPAGMFAKNVYRSLSADNTQSWSAPIKTNLSCPLSGIAARHLGKNSIIVCHNDTHEFKRTPLSLSVSSDNGLTFKKVYDLDKGDMELSYPTMELDDRGNIHVLYTFNRRMIKHVCLALEELLNEQN